MLEKYGSMPADGASQAIWRDIWNTFLWGYDKTAGQGRKFIQSLDMGLITAQAQQVIARDAHFRVLTEMQNFGREFSPAQYKQRVAHYIEHPSENTLKRAVRESRDITMTKPMEGALGYVGTGLARASETTVDLPMGRGRKMSVPVGLPITMVTPFARVSINMLAKALDFHPVIGGTKLLIKKMDGSFDDLRPWEQNLLVAQLGLGTTVVATGWWLAGERRLTESHIRFGDKWVDHRGLGPLSSSLRSGLHLYQAQGRMEQYEDQDIDIAEYGLPLLTAVAVSEGANILRSGDIFGVFRGLGMIMNEDARMVDVLVKRSKGSVSNFIPGSSLLRGVKKATDPTRPLDINVWADLQKTLPFYERIFRGYPRKTDVFGDYVLDSHPLSVPKVMSGFTPVGVQGSVNKDDKRLKEFLEEIGYNEPPSVQRMQTQSGSRRAPRITLPFKSIGINEEMLSERSGVYTEALQGNMPSISLEPQQYHDLIMLSAGREVTGPDGSPMSLSSVPSEYGTQDLHPFAGTDMAGMTFKEAVLFFEKNGWTEFMQDQLAFPYQIDPEDVTVEQKRYALAKLHQLYKRSAMDAFRLAFKGELQEKVDMAVETQAKQMGVFNSGQ